MSWHWPRIRALPALLMLLIFLAVGLAQGSAIQFFFMHRARAVGVEPLVNQLTGALGAWIALPIVWVVASNAPPRNGLWLRLAALHVGGYVAFTAVHVAAIRVLRWPLWNDGPLRNRILWEAQNDLLVYGGIAALLTLLRVWQERHASEVRTAKLEAELAKAQLEALSARLDPHFLFNALHTVGAVMHEDIARTEHLLSSLGEMLRALLVSGDPTWTIEEERAYTERYVEFLDARFGDRIAVDCHFQDGLAQARVPRFAIQALVENAAKHNQDRMSHLHVQVRADAVGDELRISVEDDGRGFSARQAADIESHGTGARGLSRLRQTLEILHGARGRLTLVAAEQGGARVSLALPRVVH